MKTVSYSDSRAKYAETLDDYQSLKETAYLLRSPENARRLITAIERLESGGRTQHELAE